MEAFPLPGVFVQALERSGTGLDLTPRGKNRKKELNSMPLGAFGALGGSHPGAWRGFRKIHLT
jgi:hypothetical protein